jgi:hypothetical protein
MSKEYKFAIRAVIQGKKKRIKHVNSLEDAERWIDRDLLGLGPNALLARTGLEKKRGQITKDGPVFDYWKCQDLFCTGGPFQIYVVRTADIT